MKTQRFVQYLQALILLAPLPFGCVGPIFMPIFYFLVLIPVLLILGQSGMDRIRKPMAGIHILAERPIRLAFYSFIFFLTIQVIPLPLFLLKILSPQSAAVFEMARGSSPTFFSISLVPVDTLDFGFRFLVMGLLVLTFMSVKLNKKQWLSLLNTLVLSATLQALFGLFKYATGNKYFFLFFHPREAYRDRLTGTLGNADHFAFFLEMILPLVLSLLFMRLKFFESKLNVKERFIAIMNTERMVIAYVLSAVVMGTAIILTGSRAGILAMSLSFLLFAELTVYLKRSKAVRKKLKLIFLSVALLATFVGIQRTTSRFLNTRVVEGGRFVVWPSTMEMFGDFPVFGCGFGTYRYAFYLYDLKGGGKWYTHAHNDYLEVLAEGGVLGAGALFLVFGLLTFSLARMWSERRHPQVRMLGIGILSSLFATIVHSFFDFSLRIPANILVLVMVFGIGIQILTYKHDFWPIGLQSVEKSRSERSSDPMGGELRS